MRLRSSRALLWGLWWRGEDRKSCETHAELVDKTSIAVWSDEVTKPVAARFGWAGRLFFL